MNPDRIEPGPGQESVWDYPRPPRIEPTDAHIRVELGGETVADTRRAVRVLETSQPPAFYLPPDDVRTEHLVPTTTRTFCEWKGPASYYTVRAGGTEAQDAAWTYADPVDAFAPIAGWFAFYAQRLDCFVDDEQVTANEGSYYGGWITSSVVGPFKGGTGTSHW
ncbi:MAG: DUF427 domain-containing protein [Acidimicrobiales bacterium]